MKVKTMKHKSLYIALTVVLCSSAAWADEEREARHDREIEEVKISKKINAANITVNKGAIAAEATTRASADVAESTARVAADSALKNAIDQEAATRATEGAALMNALSQESANRAAADATEATTRAAADAAESAARTAADAAETITREAADAAESAARIAVDTATDAALQSEMAARVAAGKATNAAVQAEVAARNTAINAEIVLRAAEDIRLQSGISTNSTGIAQNVAAIASLNSDISSINSQINSIKSSVTQAEALIAANATAIADAQVQLDNAGTNIAAVQDGLFSLIAQHELDQKTVITDINNINNQLVSLNALRETLASDLNAQLQALGNRVDGNASAIDGNLLTVITVNAKVTGINSSIHNLNSAINGLKSSQAANNSAVANLSYRLANVEADVAVLQSNAVSFVGYASWYQNVRSQSDDQQDTLMDSACRSRYPGSQAATTNQIVSGISGLPTRNYSGRYVLGKMPNGAGASYSGYYSYYSPYYYNSWYSRSYYSYRYYSAVSGHSRNCVRPNSAFPTGLPWNNYRSCSIGYRFAACVM